MSYVWMPVSNPKAVPGMPTSRIAPAGEFSLQVQPRLGDNGEFLGCQAAVLVHGHVMAINHVPPEEGHASVEQTVSATALRAQEWCELRLMVTAYGALAPADGGSHTTLNRWLEALQQSPIPQQVQQAMEATLAATSAGDAEATAPGP